MPVFKTTFLLAPVPAGMLDEMRGVIAFFFPSPASHYVAMDTEEYRELVVLAQFQLDDRGIHQRFLEHYRDIFESLFPGATKLVIQQPRLRAVRPIKGVQESIGWHRESLYGTGGEVNVWIPIQNVCIDTAMHYIPGSEKIKNEDLKVVPVVDKSCHRDSPGHQIGLLDTEHKIIGGVDFDAQRPVVVLPGEAAIFDGALIHGSGQNSSPSLRFSIDSRVIGSK